MVRPLSFTQTKGNLHIEGYPDAIALKRLDTPIARQLQAVSLHQVDLTFSRDVLTALTQLNRTESVSTAEGLWVAAITRFFKCFGSSKSRTQLSAPKILKTHVGAQAVFDYFQDLRDKHVIHDENSYTQGFTAVAVNAPNAEFKVADIISISFNAFTVDDEHLISLIQLVDVSLKWVNEKQNELHNLLGHEYEQWSHENLMNLPDIQYMVPAASAVGLKR